MPALQCALCAFSERVSRNAGLPCAAAIWYTVDALGGAGVFPCGHVLTREGEPLPWALVFGQADCGECQGSSDVPVWKTAEAWARQDAKDTLARKQEASDAAKALSESGPALGYSARKVRQMLRWLRPVCEAHCRQTGKPCPNPVVLGRVRCRMHGGKSRGPVTAEGRARIGESNRRRKASGGLGSAEAEKSNAE